MDSDKAPSLLKEIIFQTVECYQGQLMTLEIVKHLTDVLFSRLAVSKEVDPPTLTAGSVVTLKSGGPRMTLFEVKGELGRSVFFTPHASAPEILEAPLVAFQLVVDTLPDTPPDC